MMRSIVIRVSSILAIAATLFIGTAFFAPERLPEFFDDYVEAIQEGTESFSDWHRSLFTQEVFAPEDAQRELKKKKKKKRRRRKKNVAPVPTDPPADEVLLQSAATPQPTADPTKSPTGAPTPEPLIEFTAFANILRDANMTQDEKLELCLETYAPSNVNPGCTTGATSKGGGKGGKGSGGSGSGPDGINCNVAPGATSKGGKGGKGGSGKGSRKNRRRNRQLNKRFLKSGSSSGKGSGKGSGGDGGQFTTFSGGTCLCSCADPEFTELTFNGNLILIDGDPAGFNSAQQQSGKGGKGGSGKGSGKGGSGKGSRKSRRLNKSRRILRELQDRRRLICGPEDDDFFNPSSPVDPNPTSPFDGPVEPIGPDMIAFIESVMDANGITCNNLLSYMMDNSTKCASELTQPVNPAPFSMTLTGQAVIPEDILTPIGGNLVWDFTPGPDNQDLTMAILSGFPPGTEVSYIEDPNQPPVTWTSQGYASILDIPGSGSSDFEAVIQTLQVKSPPNSDDLITMIVGVQTDPTDTSQYMEFEYPITVVPQLSAPSLTTSDNKVETVENENSGAPVVFTVDGGNPDSDSEVLSLVLTVPSDENGPVGVLQANSIPGVTFVDLGGGMYSVNATGSNPADIEDALNNFIQSEAITFVPREDFNGELNGVDGITVEAILTDTSTGQTAVTTEYIDLLVIPSSESPSSSPSGCPSASPSVVGSNSPTTAPSLLPSSNPSEYLFYVTMAFDNTDMIEDITYPIGKEIDWTFSETATNPQVSSIVLKNIPAGTLLEYTLPDGYSGDTSPGPWTSEGVDDVLSITGTTEEIRDILDTLTILTPTQSDSDFTIVLGVTTDPDIENNYEEFDFDVMVQARADVPDIVYANNITMTENLDGGEECAKLAISVSHSIDSDGS
ncbi:MAG: hypothetical protein SGILL_000758, partial [Bacillariaceae sp.]